MPAERLSMRQIREVLRLRYASMLPQRAIAKSLGLSQGAVSGYLSRARAAGVVWPLPDDVDDVQLEAMLFPPPPDIAADQRPMPDGPWCCSTLFLSATRTRRRVSGPRQQKLQSRGAVDSERRTNGERSPGRR